MTVITGHLVTVNHCFDLTNELINVWITKRESVFQGICEIVFENDCYSLESELIGLPRQIFN